MRSEEPVIQARIFPVPIRRDHRVRTEEVIDRRDAPDNLASEMIVIERVEDERIVGSAFAQADVEQFPARASDDRVRVKPQPFLEGLAPCIEPAMDDRIRRVSLDPTASVLVTVARLRLLCFDGSYER